MSTDSPVALLIDNNGNFVAIPPGSPIPAGTHSILTSGYDGYNAQLFAVNSLGQQVVVGAGPGGSIPISGTVTATNPSVSSNNSAIPSSSTLVGFTDVSSNLRPATIFDADTGVGTQYVLGVNLRKSASGGSVDFGTNSDPVRIDPTGTTTQPVSGVGNFTVIQPTASNLNALVQQGSAALASAPWSMRLSDGTVFYTTITGSQLPAALVGGRLDTNIGSWLGSTAPTVGSKTSANSIPVVVASDQGTITITGTVTANVGTTNGLALDATLTSGNQTTKITDGFNTATVKAASTAATTTDTALVVAISPNNALLVNVDGYATSSSPSYINNTFNPLSLNTSGALRVDASGTTISSDISDRAGRLLGIVYGSQGQQLKQTATNFNTQVEIATGGTLIDPRSIRALTSSDVITANAGSGNFTVVQATASNLNATVSGTVTANVGTTNGLALDTSVNGILLSQGSTTSGEKGPLVQGAVTTSSPSYTNNQTSPISLTTSGAVRIDGSATTQPISGTVTANVGSTNGLALDATLSKLTIAQNTSLDANTQALVGGSVKAIAPSYSDGYINPFSLTTAGALRVDGSAITQPVSGTGNFTVVQPTAANLNATVTGSVTANIGTTNGLALDATLTGGTQTTKITDGTHTATVKAASTAAVATDTALVVAVSPNNNVTTSPQTDVSPATQNITAQDTNSTSTTIANSGVFITGTPTANSAATFTFSTIEAIKVQVTGTWTGTLTLESSIDGGTTWYSSGVHQNGTAYTTNNFTANFIGGLNTCGSTNFRVRSTAAWTGTATVKIVESVNVNSLYVVNPIKLADATTQSVQNTIKAASTAAATTDTALVVAVSPNNAIGLTDYVNGTVSVKGPGVIPVSSDTPLVVALSPLSAQSADQTVPSGNIGVADVGSTTTTGQSGQQIITGTPTLGSYRTSSVTEQTVAFNITGTWSATVQAEVSEDNATWFPVAVNVYGTTTFLSQITGNGLFIFNVAGMFYFRVRCTAFTSGVIVFSFNRSSRLAMTYLDKIVGAGSVGSPVGGVLSTQIPPNTATATLGALNATVLLNVAGTTSIGMQLAAGTLIGTIVPEVSVDNGTTWIGVFFDDPLTGSGKQSSIVFGSNNTAITRSIISSGGATNLRIRVSAYTSGTASCLLSTTTINYPGALYDAVTGTIAPPTTVQVGGNDGANIRAILTDGYGRAATFQKSSVSNTSNIASSTSSVTLLSANTFRLGATFFNDSTSSLYLKLGAAASLTSFTAILRSNGYYETPFGFTGRVDGYWPSSGTGFCRVDEFTN